jgi:hypothetical protein
MFAGEPGTIKNPPGCPRHNGITGKLLKSAVQATELPSSKTAVERGAIAIQQNARYQDMCRLGKTS